jgi:tetratricopeptide (TPR) repeat protein
MNEPAGEAQKPAGRPLLRLLMIAAAVLGAGAAVWGGFQFLRAPEKGPAPSKPLANGRDSFQRALEAVERGDQAAFRAAVAELRGKKEFEQHERLLYGIGLYYSGDFARALEAVGRVDPRGELREPMLRFTGECLFKLDRLGEAAQIFRQMIADDAESVVAHRHMAMIFHSMGAMDFSLAALRRVAELDPENHVAHRMMGKIENEDHANFPLAIEHYRRALECDPPKEEKRAIMRELAQCLVEQHEYAAALELIDQLPEAVGSMTLKSECLWNMGAHDEALALLNKAEERLPGSTLIRLTRSRMLLDQGKRSEAVLLLKEVLEREPHDYRTRYQLALAYQAMGEKEAYEREMALYEQSQQKRDELQELYRQAMQKPEDIELREQIAQLCEELGQPKLAETWRKAARYTRQALSIPTE